ncbi:hypothetical protein [Halobacillus karajensis]|uniref:hypothetical protein n=1 Tax=Halobacillus karajensis TaxID=195088 RepID=UPI00045D4547|nr:hypothetical protein [Halobacillus karajensis]CDQ21729.1 hypothetical protein BN982_04138 [Halobacillus karajensis]
MEKALFLIGMIFVVLLEIGLKFVLAPFILVKVLALFGITASFWLAFGICFLIFLLIGTLKQ